MLKVMIPKNEGIYKIAADEFVSFWKKVTGKKLSVTTKDDGKSDLVIFGSDAVNGFVHAKIIEKLIPQFEVRTGSDDYQLRSVEAHGRKYLFLAAGRPRALLYAVYHFFEYAAGCSYFWDGDVVPKVKDLDIDGLDILEIPRFEYRGLRYFAHRGLERFQAEHWDFEDWKREIAWMLKKRFNVFMLRIGMDDLFQKAFPDVVKYPGHKVPESIDRSYDDRNLFWPLKYRGELRKKLLAYARERDLIHPEDIGTMTHWYSRTPYDFLNHFKPSFIPQTTEGYNQETGLVWDIREDKNLDMYYHLTKTHIREYGAPDMFHTIGMAERRCYEDHTSNHQMKLYTYRRIISKLREDYPHAPLLIGSWDFGMYWTNEEVQSLVNELDPQNTLIFDYTSDTTDPVVNFTNWGVVGRFPWIFGIFHALMPSSAIRGNYVQIEQRLPIAAEDPMCKGMVFWPENSHADTLMLDYMPSIAWNPWEYRIDDFLPKFCERRYLNHTGEMYAIWKKSMPLIKKNGWMGCQDKLKLPAAFCDLVFKFLCPIFVTVDMKGIYGFKRLHEHLEKEITAVPEIFRMLKETTGKISDDFMRRDIVDLGRTMISRLQTFLFSNLYLAMEDWRNGLCKPEKVKTILKDLQASMKLESALLDSHEDYCLNDALHLLQQKHETYPEFENTLKANTETQYCRSYVSELFSGLYLPEFKVFEKWILDKMAENDHSPWVFPEEKFESEQKKIQDKFYETPLRKYTPDRAKAYKELPQTFGKLAVLADKIVK